MMKNEPQHPYVQCHCVNFELKIAFFSTQKYLHLSVCFFPNSVPTQE